MTNTKLLPLPEPNGSYTNPYDSDDLENYALVNMEPLLAEIEALRAEAARLRRSLHEAVVHGNRQSGRAERLTEALREAADMLLADYPETAKRLRAALHPTAAQEGKSDE